MNDHDAVLASFYTRQVPPIELDVRQARRWQIESDRRILDLCRIVNGSWPLTSAYASAHFDDDFVLEIAALLPQQTSHAMDMTEGIASATDAWAAERQDRVLIELIAYERAASGELSTTRTPSPQEMETLDAGVAAQYRLFNVSCDILPFIKTLRYYVNASAPSKMIRQLHPKVEPHVLAFCTREGKVFCADVSAQLNPAEPTHGSTE